jgi:hypothetical protein
MLTLERGQSIRVTARRTGPLTGVWLRRQEAPPQRLLRAALLRCNRRNGRPLGRMVRQLLADQSDGPLTDLGTESIRSGFRHSSKFSQNGASCNSGAVQRALQTLLTANKRLNTAYVLKEQFAQLWEYRSEVWARKFFEEWCKALR